MDDGLLAQGRVRLLAARCQRSKPTANGVGQCTLPRLSQKGGEKLNVEAGEIPVNGISDPVFSIIRKILDFFRRICVCNYCRNNYKKSLYEITFIQKIIMMKHLKTTNTR